MKSNPRLAARTRLLAILAAGAVGGAVPCALAHSDLEKPRYVAAGGQDSGDCLDPAYPCGDISRAVGLAGKGGQVRVAEGSYVVQTAEDLFNLLSGVVEVRGGFRRADGFRSTPGVSQLIGVPAEYRAELEQKGFAVIADRKGIDGPEAAATEQMLALRQSLQGKLAAAPCLNGQVAGLECQSVDLLSHVAFADLLGAPGAAADIWGFVDLNSNREYVIIGVDTGTAVLDVTDPIAPEQVGFVLGRMAVWRDIKVYQFFDAGAGRWRSYAYVTTDGPTNGSGDGMIVIDLTGLPNTVESAGYVSDFTAAHNVFATNSDFATGLRVNDSPPALIVAGSNFANSNGRFRAYSLANPAAPAFVSMPIGTASDYMHDAASMIITDGRKDTQCINAGTYCEVLFDFNETTVDIWDITDLASPQRLSRTQYANRGYVHSGWKSDDDMYLFVEDELDEQRFGLRTTLRVFSLQDLRAPVEQAGWSGSTGAIDHNGFVRGNRYYMSNYSRGLTILDITDPTAPVEAGHIDTYPFSNSASFVGAWGTYPYFPSGTVAISDIDSGLYLVSDETRDVPAGRLEFAAVTHALVEGTQLSVPVLRNGGTAGPVTVGFRVVPASADAADYTVQSGTLSWPDGDGTARTIDIAALNDGVAEGMERLLLQLVAPTGGATLGVPDASSIYLSDPGQVTEIAFLDAAIDKNERDRAAAVVVLKRLGSAAGAVSVDYAMSAGTATAGQDVGGDLSGTVTWADGDGDPKSLRIPIIDDAAVESTEFIELSLDNPLGGAVIAVPATVRINVADNDQSAPPPPPPRSGSGGGTTGPALLLAMLLAVARRVSRRDWTSR